MGKAFPAHIIRFDMGLCALFAVPGLSGLVLSTIDGINAAFGLGGQVGSLTGTAHFFVNFAGLLGVLLNYVLLRSRDARSHWANVIARFGVASLICGYVAFGSLPVLFLLFVGTEIIGAVLTLPWLRQTIGQSRQ